MEEKMKKIFNPIISSLSKNNKGATAVEYVLIISLIALAIILGLAALGGGINTTFTNIITIIQGAIGT